MNVFLFFLLFFLLDTEELLSIEVIEISERGEDEYKSSMYPTLKKQN